MRTKTRASWMPTGEPTAWCAYSYKSALRLTLEASALSTFFDKPNQDHPLEHLKLKPSSVRSRRAKPWRIPRFPVGKALHCNSNNLIPARTRTDCPSQQALLAPPMTLPASQRPHSHVPQRRLLDQSCFSPQSTLSQFSFFLRA